jgi:hypothetical protein
LEGLPPFEKVIKEIELIDTFYACAAGLTGKQYAPQLALSKVSRRQRDTTRAFGPKPPRLKPPAF